MEDQWMKDLDLELDSQLDLELLLMDLKALAQEIDLELAEVLEPLIQILKDLE
jgi:hypothetical protein